MWRFFLGPGLGIAVIAVVIGYAAMCGIARRRARARMTPEELAADREQERVDMQTW